jgi:hypothetical protein
MDYTKLLEQSPKILCAILIAGALFLIAPASVLGRMSLNDFWLRPYIGIVTILAAALLVTHGVAYLVNHIRAKRSKKKEQEDRERSELDTLRALTPAEKRALQPYIVENENSVGFSIADGVAGGLVAKKILYRSANASFGYSFPHNLQPWAREHLTKHPGLLEISETELSALETDDEE